MLVISAGNVIYICVEVAPLRAVPTSSKAFLPDLLIANHT